MIMTLRSARLATLPAVVPSMRSQPWYPWLPRTIMLALTASPAARIDRQGWSDSSIWISQATSGARDCSARNSVRASRLRRRPRWRVSNRQGPRVSSRSCGHRAAPQLMRAARAHDDALSSFCAQSLGPLIAEVPGKCANRSQVANARRGVVPRRPRADSLLLAGRRVELRIRWRAGSRCRARCASAPAMRVA